MFEKVNLFIKNFSTFLLLFIINNVFLSKTYYLKASNDDLSIKEEIYLKNIESKENSIYKSNYILGFGDVINIKFQGIKIFTDQYSIDREGNLDLPELGIIKATGYSINELETILTEKYKEFIFEPDISIQIIVFKPINVVVKGEVARPGLYTFKARRINLYQDNLNSDEPYQPRLFDIFKLSNGITQKADLSNIKIIRNNSLDQGGGKIKSSVSVLDIINKGDLTQNIELHNEDLIIVPESKDSRLNQILMANKSNLTPDKMTIFINGNVTRQGAITIKQGATLFEAIAASGGARPLDGKIEFIRFDENGTAQKRIFSSLSNSSKNSKNNPILIEGDILFVRKNLIGKTTSILSEIGTPIISAATLYQIFD